MNVYTYSLTNTGSNKEATLSTSIGFSSDPRLPGSIGDAERRRFVRALGSLVFEAWIVGLLPESSPEKRMIVSGSSEEHLRGWSFSSLPADCSASTSTEGNKLRGVDDRDLGGELSGDETLL